MGETEPSQPPESPELKQPAVDTDYAPQDGGGATAVTDPRGIIYNPPYESD